MKAACVTRTRPAIRVWSACLRCASREAEAAEAPRLKPATTIAVLAPAQTQVALALPRAALARRQREAAPIAEELAVVPAAEPLRAVERARAGRKAAPRQRRAVRWARGVAAAAKRVVAPFPAGQAGPTTAVRSLRGARAAKATRVAPPKAERAAVQVAKAARVAPLKAARPRAVRAALPARVQREALRAYSSTTSSVGPRPGLRSWLAPLRW
jgi:hypothetical protein